MATTEVLPTLPTLLQQERRRKIEVRRYGRLLRSTYRSDQSLEDEDEGFASASTSPSASPEPLDSQPVLATDGTFTALAQLVACRMNVRRAFISLADGASLHIIAEATRTISPFNVSDHAEGDQLILGARSVPLKSVLTYYSLPAYAGDQSQWYENEHTILNGSKFVSSDLQAEARMQHIAIINADPSKRFYAEVPVCNEKGTPIGMVGALDDAPRSCAADVDVRPMQQVAQLVTEHLELVNLKEIAVSAERLMQGLGHFNSGQSSISKWTMNNPKQALEADADNYRTQHAQSTNLTADLLAKSQPGGSRYRGEPASSISTKSELPLDSPTTNSPLNERIQSAAVQNTQVNSLLVSEESFRTTVSSEPVDAQSRDTTADVQESEAKPDERDSTPPPSSLVADTFARASNLMRESLDLDAACFLEISAHGRFNSDNQKKQKPAPDGSKNQDDRSVSTSDNPARTLQSETDSTKSSSNTELDGDGPSSHAILCNILAFSTRQKSSLRAEPMSSSCMSVPESVLKRLVEIYPQGHIFNFDAYGAISSEDDTQLKPQPQRAQRRRNLARAVGKGFPGSRSLLFMPLYDNERQSMYTVFFGWTCVPWRILLESESVYVSGFANSVMCEVMRLESLARDKAKSDFISSMSHELRSPLHGILAATHLIQESQLSREQIELAAMIDSCSSTLLDIMNNVLEHAKINSIISSTRRKRRPRGQKSYGAAPGSRRPLLSTPAQSLEPINLAAVIEETVSSIAVGHTLNKGRGARLATQQLSSTRQNSGHTLEPVHQRPDSDGPQVAIILDVQHRDDWHCKADAGQWRRVVMNLLGNALKYTTSGHVRVSLESRSIPRSTPEGSTRDMVVLTVSDTGQGISESYLKHRLYTPFAQEDNLSVGVGLGLSIVDRLVAGMSGTIRVNSDVGVGTEIIVSVPAQLTTYQSDVHVSSKHDVFRSIARSLHTDNGVSFLGFDIYPDLDAEPTGRMDPKARALLELKETLMRLVTSWFGLRVTANINDAAILVIEASHDYTPPDGKDMKRIFVDAFDFHAPREDRQGHEALTCTPIGPVKLAHALAAVIGLSGDSVQTHESLRPGRGDLVRSKSYKETLAVHGSGVLTPPSSVDTTSVNDAIDCRLLLVEDNSINLRILANLARKLEVPYLTASNGQEALDQYIAAYDKRTPVQHIFMDISMPIMDGLTATRHIRNFEKEKKVIKPAKIFALTGLGHAEIQEEALASGVDQYHCKPVKLSLLKALLRTIE